MEHSVRQSEALNGRNPFVSEAQLTALEAKCEHDLRVPCYCEENVWRLAYRRSQKQKYPGNYHVVFISNEIQCVPMFYQLAASNPEQPCFWDYHVILLYTPSSNESSGTKQTNRIRQRTMVLDMDSHLKYPCLVSEYIENTFPVAFASDQEKYAPLFRVVEVSKFLDNFCSDRMHMFNVETGQWNATPPEYECIKSQKNSGQSSNLKCYINVTKKWSEDSAFGSVLTMDELVGRFSSDSCGRQLPRSLT